MLYINFITEIYSVISSFCEYLIQYIDDSTKKFNASSYCKIKHTRNYSQMYETIINKFNLSMDYMNFYSTILELFKQFKSEILDVESEFYKRPNIEHIFKFLHFLLNSEIFVINYSVQNKKNYYCIIGPRKIIISTEYLQSNAIRF